MNPLVKKEIRLLLPSWLAGVLLALGTGLIPEDPRGQPVYLTGFVMLLFVLGPAMLVTTALSSFGGEFGSGTFSLLLSQPVSRRRIWRTKTLLLAAALLSVWLIWCISYSIQAPMRAAGWYSSRQIWPPSALFVLALYSGGLWTVLLFRQVAAAIWFTVLTPAALFLTVLNLLERHPDQRPRALVIAFVVYGLAGFLLARWLFLRAQDAHWMGSTIALPEIRGWTRFRIGSGEGRTWHPRVALLRKELQLHQSQLLLAGGLLLLHLGVIAMRTWKHFPKNSTEEFLLGSFWIFWLVMPLVAGCAAVADERKAGTLEGQLCLPAKRRTQFAIKLFVTLALAVGLGTIMPWLLEGNRILPDIHFNADDFLASFNPYVTTTLASIVRLTLLNILVSLSPWLPLFLLALLSASIAALAFYASTLGRNTLQALGLALLGLLVAWLLVAASVPGVINFGMGNPLWQSGLIYLIGVPVMVLVLAALAFWNFKRALVGWTVWRRNLLTIALSLALVTLATTALYHRAWERLTPLEPPHGAVRLASSTGLRINSGDLAVFLPDGRVWLNRYWSDTPDPNVWETTHKIVPSSLFGGGRFLDGTNWTDVAECGLDIVGLQRDGSLWVSETPERRIVHWGLGEKPATASTRLVRFGNDHDWKNIAVKFPGPFLLKTDGTLWRWGTWGTNRVHRLQNWPGLRAFEPQRLGTNSDWAEIFSAGNRTFFRKTDGQMWAYPTLSDSETKQPLELDHDTILGRVQSLDRRSTVPVQPPYWNRLRVGVCEDGTLRILACEHWNRQSRNTEMVATDLQFGNETNWRSVAGRGGRMVTLKRDGSLWLWTFQRDRWSGWDSTNNWRHFQNTTPVRLGTHSDWIAVGEMMGGVVSLAADGSLWRWRFEPQYFYSRQATPWLAVSRRPQFLGNVLGKAD
jgi:hypothetical protein